MSVGISYDRLGCCTALKNTLAAAIFAELEQSPGCAEFNAWVRQQVILGNCCDFSIEELPDSVVSELAERWDGTSRAIFERLGHMREYQGQVRRQLRHIGAMLELAVQERTRMPQDQSEKEAGRHGLRQPDASADS